MLGSDISRFALAAAIPYAIITGAQLGTAMLIGETGSVGELLRQELPISLTHLAMFGVPFGILALARTPARSYWIVATLLTLAYWSLYVYSVWRSSLNNFEGGADIGLGLIMLTAPLVIPLAFVLVRAVRHRRPPPANGV